MVTQTSKLKPADYVHLHNHTQYSLLDGLTKIPELISYVKDLGMEAVSVTDHGTLSGLIEFYKEANNQGIKPILGIETYVASRNLEDKEVGLDKNNYHLILLAKSNKGYQNLMKLSTIANLEGFYYKPRIDRKTLKKYSEGLVCLSACMGSEMGQAILNNQYSEALKIAKWYKDVFQDDYYLEIQDHGHPEHPTYNPEQHRVNDNLFKIAEELKIKTVVTCDAHYLRHSDQIAHEVLLCIQTNSYLNDTNRFSLKDFELHVTEPKQIIKRWGKEHPELITNTKDIANKCQVEIKLGETLIPKFDVPAGFSNEAAYLNELVYQGLKNRYIKNSNLNNIEKIKSALPEEILKRAEYELGIIESMHFSGYFLIVQDFINWGKDQGIIFGPGRGSAAGSIVAYALKITEIDPFKYNLMFERFLNPNRISMPDIDIDIQDSRRDEVIEYCVSKYGSNRVANIVTFGKMAARNAVRDVARVLEVPYQEADRLAKMLPMPVQGRHIPLKVSLKEDKNLKNEYDSNETAKSIFDLAVQLEGTIRSHGVHAAGVVIAPSDISEYVPLELAQKGVIATQYNMGPIDELGLLKIDFLGLSNLTTINNTIRIIKKVYKDDIKLLEIPNDDPKTFELLQRADTTGIFQLESSGMKRYLKELKPNLFEDIVAMGALYRPGPMSEIPNFIKGKNNPGSITYLHESLKPILEETYGVIVYQEQIIKLLQLVAGYTAGEADLVRKAIGKKNRAIMAAEEPKFITGCINQGLTKKSAQKLWELIQPFADYSFNKAHATCYGQISYWTAYLKAHYPNAYMAALMTTDYDNSDRLGVEINECKKMNIEVLPPSINKSFVEFGIDTNNNQIRYGLKAVKNVGEGAATEIVESRKDTPYKSIEDYLNRVNPKISNKKVLESLIKVGAFDEFEDRQLLLDNIELLIEYASQNHKNNNSKQVNIFANLDDQETTKIESYINLIRKNNDIDKRQYLSWERELLGLYISQHPLAEFSDYIKKNSDNDKDFSKLQESSLINVIGIISNIHNITTKSNQKMAFVKIETLNKDFEIVVFPKLYDEVASSLNKDKVYMFKLKVSSKSNNNSPVSFIAESINEIDVNSLSVSKYSGPGAKDIDQNLNEKVYLKLNDLSDTRALNNIKEVINNYPGSTPVIIVIGENEAKQAIKLPAGINMEDQDSINNLSNLVGSSNLRIA